MRESARSVGDGTTHDACSSPPSTPPGIGDAVRLWRAARRHGCGGGNPPLGRDEHCSVFSVGFSPWPVSLGSIRALGRQRGLHSQVLAFPSPARKPAKPGMPAPAYPPLARALETQACNLTPGPPSLSLRPCSPDRPARCSSSSARPSGQPQYATTAAPLRPSETHTCLLAAPAQLPALRSPQARDGRPCMS